HEAVADDNRTVFRNSRRLHPINSQIPKPSYVLGDARSPRASPDEQGERRYRQSPQAVRVLHDAPRPS
ncbi:MAG: hypothetical protein NZM28_03435, partial [Fimbriimonadales bacterium]|nr:hypothetical protein [Fimbriimonadales bacterium]